MNTISLHVDNSPTCIYLQLNAIEIVDTIWVVELTVFYTELLFNSRTITIFEYCKVTKFCGDFYLTCFDLGFFETFWCMLGKLVSHFVQRILNRQRAILVKTYNDRTLKKQISKLTDHLILQPVLFLILWLC